ncbi:MAG TPA: glycosyltransferase [Ignavibacteriaceae bacterium]
MTASQKHIKILHLTLRSDWGGAPKHIDILYKNINPDFLIYFAAPISEPYGTSWYKSVGKERFFELEHRKFSILKLVQLKLFIKNNGIKIIHAHGKGAGLYGRLLKILLPKSIKVIFTFHGLHIDKYSPLKKKLYILYEQFFSRFTDLFISVSNGEKDNCIRHKIFNSQKSKVVYNSIPELINQKSKTDLRVELDLPIEKFIVLSIVRFSFAKNIEDTIAIADLLKPDQRFLIVLVGDGETRAEIESEIKNRKLNNILLPGFKNNPLDYIATSDVYLSTSRWEGLPYSLIEASMMGLPSVASDVVGNNEVVKNDFNGKLFKPGNLKAAAQSIIEICTDKRLSEFYSMNSKKFYNDNFSVDKMITQMQNIYNEIIN